ncbi:variable surface protein [Plasmodium gonderi]|uniref:Variable surface protein n=1 Tax=Plasmodium gonderi TaxID=77519 RepID=A0A1Y1JQE8_PLAGO|nr:variable surface protein [Plasmodium gonderi]GAW84420.1 variable surface protein [Plasmodium gonderi]
MDKSIYKIAEYFDYCRERLNIHAVESDGTGGTWGNVCKEESYKKKLKELIGDNGDEEKICIQAMQYLGEVNAAEVDSLKEAGCNYLYYWIYDNIFKKDISKNENIKKIFIELIRIFREKIPDKDEIGEHITQSNEVPFVVDDLPKVEAIYNINKNDIYIKNACSSYKDEVFCEAIKGYVEKYNIIIKTQDRLIHEPIKIQTNTSCQYHIGVPIIITLIISLLTLVFIFLLYKFTKFGSFFRRTILRKGKNGIIWMNK